MISAFTFTTVDLFQTMVSHIDTIRPALWWESTNPIWQNNAELLDTTGDWGRSRFQASSLKYPRLRAAFHVKSCEQNLIICLQTTWSWCCSPQPSLSLELPASGPDPRSSISLWVHRPVPHVPELFTFYRWFSHIWITQRLHVIRCRLSVELPLKFFLKKWLLFSSWTLFGRVHRRKTADKGQFIMLELRSG